MMLCVLKRQLDKQRHFMPIWGMWQNRETPNKKQHVGFCFCYPAKPNIKKGVPTFASPAKTQPKAAPKCRYRLPQNVSGDFSCDLPRQAQQTGRQLRRNRAHSSNTKVGCSLAAASCHMRLALAVLGPDWRASWKDWQRVDTYTLRIGPDGAPFRGDAKRKAQHVWAKTIPKPSNGGPFPLWRGVEGN